MMPLIRISCLLLGMYGFLHTSSAAKQPVITEFMGQNKSVVHSSPMMMLCMATGDPEPHIYWTKKGNTINYDSFPVPGGSVLWIEQARSRGPYSCVADNGVGEPAQVTSYPQIISPNSVPVGFPIVTQSPSLKAVEAGRNAVMSCEAEGDPTPDITWYKDFIPIVESPRLTVLSSGYLQIMAAELSDEGVYECMAENIFGVATSYQATLYVRVRPVPPMFVVIPPPSMEVTAGQSVHLRCIASGSPTPAVRWTTGDTLLSDDSPGVNVLRLDDLQESAEYTCTATSMVAEVSFTVTVDVLDIPDAH